MIVTTRLDRLTQRAREEPQLRFTALMGLVFDPEGLRESFERQDGRKAPGVDGMEQYAQGLDERLAELSARVRRLGYRPEPCGAATTASHASSAKRTTIRTCIGSVRH